MGFRLFPRHCKKRNYSFGTTALWEEAGTWNELLACFKDTLVASPETEDKPWPSRAAGSVTK